MSESLWICLPGVREDVMHGMYVAFRGYLKSDFR